MADEFQLKPIHPIATVLNNLRLIALVGVLGTVLGAIAILAKMKPEYRAEAVVEVRMVQNRILVFDPENQFVSRLQYTDFVNTQVGYIASRENLAAALDRIQFPNPALIPAPTKQETIQRLMRMIEIRPVSDTYFLTIAINGVQPEGLAEIANAIMETYLESVSQQQVGVDDTRRLFLRGDLAQKRAELEKLYSQLANYSRDLGTFNFQETSNPHDANLEFLREALNNAYLARVEAESRYESLVQSYRLQREAGVGPMVDEFVYSDTNTQNFRDQTFEVQEELRRQSALMTENHPSVRINSERAQASERYLEEALERSRQTATGIFEGRMELEHTRDLAEAQAEMNARRQIEEDIQGRIRQEQEALDRTTASFLKAQQTKAEINNLEERIVNISARLDDLSLEANAPGRIRVKSEAINPIFPLKDRRKLFLVVVCVLAFVGGLFLAFVKDFLNPYIVDPRHVGQIIGGPPTGDLAYVKDLDDFALLLRNAPQRYHADRFRRMMPKLFTENDDGSQRSVFVTISLSHGGGATSFGLNCMTHLENVELPAAYLEVTARSQSNLPKRLADWDLSEQPTELSEELNRAFPLKAKKSDRSHGFFYFERSCHKETISNPELVGSLVDKLKERYQTVIIDAPPLLKQSEAEIFCQLADVVILVVPGPECKVGELRKGMSVLKGLGVKRVAVIANKLPILPGGYFGKAIAEYEGKDPRFQLARDVIDAVWRAAMLPERYQQRFLKLLRLDAKTIPNEVATPDTQTKK
jgi:uncharacterized protein involved in exopolysaccharide biosynthesis